MRSSPAPPRPVSVWSALALLAAARCVQVEEPPCPKVVIPEQTTGCSQFCDCKAEDITGRAFRLTRLEIDEPDAFAALLNLLWETDLKNNVLNVLFLVEQAVQGDTSNFKKLHIRAGPGWRSPRDPLTLVPDEGKTSAEMVDSYCFLSGLSFSMDLLPYHGYQCQLKSDGDASLLFHPGPKDTPLMCAPHNSPPNNIPIAGLRLRASFDRECKEIVDGYLEGCLTVPAADGICMCAAAGICGSVEDPLAAGAPDPDNLDDYCSAACGDGWFSFGATARAVGLLPTCLTPAGEEGYRVQGFFDAVAIDGKFNPVQSADCTKE